MTDRATDGSAHGVTCPACGADDWRPWHDVRGVDGRAYSYRRCARCRLGRLERPPGAGDLTGWYDEGYFVGGGERGGYLDYAGEEAAHRANARARMDRVDAAAGLPDPPGRSGRRVFVEIGCATGETLDEARARGWTTYGVELSEWAAAVSRARGHVVVGSVADLPDQVRSVAAVGLFQVLEHLPDPAAVVAELGRRMAPGGVLVCETWDAGSRVARAFGRRWQQLSAPPSWPPQRRWCCAPSVSSAGRASRSSRSS